MSPSIANYRLGLGLGKRLVFMSGLTCQEATPETDSESRSVTTMHIMNGSNIDALRQVDVWPNSRQRVVVLHADSHLFIHGKPGCVLDRRTHAVADRVRRGPCQTDGHQVRHHHVRIDKGLLQGKDRATLYYQHFSLFLVWA